MSVVTDVFLPVALAFIMFALGLGLTFEDFARVARRPRDFFVGAVSQIVLLPIVAGLLTRRLAARFAHRFERRARTISAVLFAIVLLGAIFAERANIVEYFAQAGLITLVLNLVMMALASALARGFATGPRQRIAISIECGLQNGTLAIAVAATLFGGGLVSVPAATYSLIMFATALMFIAVLRRLPIEG